MTQHIDAPANWPKHNSKLWQMFWQTGSRQRCPAEETRPELMVQDGKTEDAVEREMAAYIALHPQLKEQCLGQYVAIHGGALVDHDYNCDQLFDRADTAFPSDFVWLTQVDSEPLKTLVFRSPRLEPPGK